jgi:hypothetical protein
MPSKLPAQSFAGNPLRSALVRAMEAAQVLTNNRRRTLRVCFARDGGWSK